MRQEQRELERELVTIGINSRRESSSVSPSWRESTRNAVAMAAARAAAATSSTERATLLDLGAALCHSQTRARQAEEGSQAMMEERERLVRLLWREFDNSYAAKQWIAMLEAELNHLQSQAHAAGVLPQRLRFSTTFLHELAEGVLQASRLSAIAHIKAIAKDAREGKHEAFASNADSDDYLSDAGDLELALGLTAVAFSVGLAVAGAVVYIAWRLGWIVLAV